MAVKRIGRGLVRKARRRRVRRNRKSGLETLVEEALRAKGVEFKTQYKIGRCHADLYFPGTNTAVELNGCWFHGHSCLAALLPRHKRARDRDRRRYTFFLNRGLHLLVVWECDAKRDLAAVLKKLLTAAGHSR